MTSENHDHGWNLFGFEIKKKVDKSEPQSFVPEINEDGGTHVTVNSGAAYNSYSIDLDPSSVKDEIELVRKYREISLVSDIDIAVDEIVNELLIYDEYKPPLEIDFTEDFAKSYSEKTKNVIKEEFENILSMMNFNTMGSDVVRSWYVDGKLAYHKVIVKDKPKNGIVELRPIDVAKMKRVIEIQKEKDPQTGVDIIKGQQEYFVYSEAGFVGNEKMGLKIAKDAIAYVTSGVIDKTTGMVLSYLHKAIRPMNQLRMMEDSEVIYRMGRAPQRRVFYIDTNGMARTKAEQYIKDVMARYKNKQVYDVATGTVSDSKKHLSILEDFWLPRANGGKGTEITTLDGGGCLAMDTKVKLLDGRDLSITDIEAEMHKGEILWTYSCHPETGAVVPGLISWAGITQESAQVMKITLDNGEEIICTPDHKFPVQGKGFVEAKDLVIDESLFPLYTRKEKIEERNASTYEQFFDNEDKTWKFTHRAVAKSLKNIVVPEFEYKLAGRKTLVHHIDHNRYNNSPSNLCYMSWSDHKLYHSDAGFSVEDQKKGSLAGIEKMNWIKSNDKVRYAEICESRSKLGKVNIKKYLESLTPQELELRAEQSRLNGSNAAISTVELMKNPNWRKQRSLEQSQVYVNLTQAQKNASVEQLRKGSLKNWESKEFREFITAGRKILIDNTIVKYIIDNVKGKTTHQVTLASVVDILNNNDEMIALLNSINKDNFTGNLKFSPTIIKNRISDFGYSSWKDFRVKESLHNHRISKIEYLEDKIQVGTLTIDAKEKIHNYHTFALTCGVFTKNSLGDPGSISYYQNKLYQSLNIPLSRLQGGASSTFNMGRENEISRDEVKFSKFIEKLRRKLNGLFLDILRTQLILKGIATQEDWEVIKGKILFNYVEDNFYAEIKESEMLKERMLNVQVADPYVGKYFSKRFIQREILKLTDEQLKTMDEENAEDEQLQQQQEEQMMEKLGIDPNNPTGEEPTPVKGPAK